MSEVNLELVRRAIEFLEGEWDRVGKQEARIQELEGAKGQQYERSAWKW